MANYSTSMLKMLGMNAQGDLGPLTMYRSKRHRRVFYAKAPPEVVASIGQLRQRVLFTTTALTWHGLTKDEKNAWELAATRAHLRITGFNLWTFSIARGDLSFARTVSRQSGVKLTYPQVT